MKKVWTFREAKVMFPVIREITEEYFALVKELEDVIKNTIMPENEMEDLEQEAKKLKIEWAREINKREVDVKGLWLVDFDNGKGYYCWKIGEKDLMYEHSYEEGFAGRKPIKKDDTDDVY